MEAPEAGHDIMSAGSEASAQGREQQTKNDFSASYSNESRFQRSVFSSGLYPWGGAPG